MTSPNAHHRTSLLIRDDCAMLLTTFGRAFYARSNRSGLPIAYVQSSCSLYVEVGRSCFLRVVRLNYCLHSSPRRLQLTRLKLGRCDLIPTKAGTTKGPTLEEVAMHPRLCHSKGTILFDSLKAQPGLFPLCNLQPAV